MKNREHIRKLDRERYKKDPERFRAKSRIAMQQSRKTRGLIIQEAKNRPCADCGQRFPYFVMDFDHRNGNKAFAIGRRDNRRLEKLKQEIAKCDVVCANCHRMRTYAHLIQFTAEIAEGLP